jgi:hypothetical protein
MNSLNRMEMRTSNRPATIDDPHPSTSNRMRHGRREQINSKLICAAAVMQL